MTMQETLKTDMIKATKERNEVTRDNLKFILGEFQRASKNKEKTIDDDTAVRVLKKLQKGADDTISILNKQNKDIREHVVFRSTIETYLPTMASEDDIKTFITENIDLTTFKNKMQAMRPIMEHFGSTVDGNTVKSILMSM